MNNTTSESQKIVITRTFDSPLTDVWSTWTDQERVKSWWGPKGYTAPSVDIDFRTGGRYLLCMRSPEGKDFWSTGVYREIVPQRKIVSSDSFSDEKGNVVGPEYYDMPAGLAKEALITVEFEEQQGRTNLTLHHFGIPEGEWAEMCTTGWNESFDKLEASLKSGRILQEKAS